MYVYLLLFAIIVFTANVVKAWGRHHSFLTPARLQKKTESAELFFDENAVDWKERYINLRKRQVEIYGVDCHELLSPRGTPYQQLISKIIRPSKYANLIALKENQVLLEYFDSYLVYDRPKELIFSNDIFFVKNIGKKIIFGMLDCFGIGPEGYLSSFYIRALINNALYKQNCNEISLDLLMDELDSTIADFNAQIGDLAGFNCTICLHEKGTEEFSCTGNRPLLFHVRNDEVTRFIHKRRKYVGDTRSEIPFETFSVSIQKGDVIYFSSDGYADQNNKDRIRFGNERLKKLFKNIYKFDSEQQILSIDQELADWKSQMDQRDDILIVGIRI